jgi:outer membrane immunogenic protein
MIVSFPPLDKKFIAHRQGGLSPAIFYLTMLPFGWPIMKKIRIAILITAALIGSDIRNIAAQEIGAALIGGSDIRNVAAQGPWTGLYVGLNAGGNFGSSQPSQTYNGFFIAPNTNVITGAAANNRIGTDGFTGGIQAGFNRQIGNLVVGGELDFEYFRTTGSASVTGVYPFGLAAGGTFNNTTTISTDWLFTARPRLGYATSNWLIYATGGLAVTELKAASNFSDVFAETESASWSLVKPGYAFGGGLEVAALPGWAIGIEYLRTTFYNVSVGSTNFSPCVPGCVVTHSVNLNDNIVRLRLDRQFGAETTSSINKTLAAPKLPFFLFDYNSYSYSYIFNATNPETALNAGHSPKNDFNFTHYDEWAYGTNLFSVDWLKATNGIPGQGLPAAPCDVTQSPGCAGYTQIYGYFRSTLGWNQITHSNNFAYGPLKNIEFAVGADLDTDNTTLESSERSIQAGLQLDFIAPYSGFLKLGIYAYKEREYDGISATFGPNFNGNVEFKTTWKTEAIYFQPLRFLPSYLPLNFSSTLVVVGPKGPGEIGVPGRITEYYTQQTLSLDVGKIAADKPNSWYGWVGYRYWKNKYGVNPTTSGIQDTLESTWILGTTLVL